MMPPTISADRRSARPRRRIFLSESGTERRRVRVPSEVLSFARAALFEKEEEERRWRKGKRGTTSPPCLASLAAALNGLHVVATVEGDSVSGAGRRERRSSCEVRCQIRGRRRFDAAGPAGAPRSSSLSRRCRARLAPSGKSKSGLRCARWSPCRSRWGSGGAETSSAACACVGESAGKGEMSNRVGRLAAACWLGAEDFLLAWVGLGGR